ncbi:hypothetical protein BURC_00732 [Burkholderiaceae bacterium]|nr:hypothetical protein BURC_00732 [Burkholderiaceae bacterium]
MSLTGGRFYARWVAANAWSEGLGLGGSLLLGHALASGMEAGTPDPATIVLGALLAVLAGTLLEGVLVGWAQGRVLAAGTPRISVRDWTRATAVGAGIAWTLGMLPSTLMALHDGGSGAASPSLSAASVLLLAGAMGGVLGPILALAQWRVLRRASRRPARWLLANAAAWSVGMVLLFAAMEQLEPDADPLAIALRIVLACTLAGAAVGAVHGGVLIRMLADGERAELSEIPAPLRR